MENQAFEAKATKGEAVSLTMEYVLERIDRILEDTRYIHEAIEAIKTLDIGDQSPMSQRPDSRGEAIAATVKARETTNQRLLDMFKHMYDDLKPVKPSEPKNDMELERLRALAESIHMLDADPDESLEALTKIAERVFTQR